MTQTEQAGGQNTVWLTQDAFDKLQSELDHLKGTRRQEIVAEISAARDEGDLKENGGYHAAREEQGKNEARIAQLEDMIRRAEIGETPPDDGVVEPGMVVTYKFEGDDDDEAETFLLLGSREAPSDGLTVYTPEAPLGAAINGKSKGDTVSYEVNGRTQTVIILDAKPFQS
ncbi:transcription elongation factor GreA [Nocardioides sambongensis]|uniref:transcription elongation factor GreA n=1 Tax=Nocardioides sambongensis TaxID=2589074 RepID=UPI0011274CF0|nr:transcription elongation factor GreA [Nocardioides sambongensis]